MKFVKSSLVAGVLLSALALFGESNFSVSELRCWPLKDHAETRKIEEGKTELHLLKGSLLREKLLDIQPYFYFSGTLKPGEYLLETDVLSTKNAKMQVRIQKRGSPWTTYSKISVVELTAGKTEKISITFRMEKEENDTFRMPGFRFANVEKGARIVFSNPIIKKVK